MVLEERAPSLRGRLADAHHVFGHAGLADVEAEFEEFTVNAECTPGRILAAHPTDQISDFARDDGASRLSMPNRPGPEEAKPLRCQATIVSG